MLLMVYLFTMLTTLRVIDALTLIEIHCGQLSIEGYENCEITYNNQVMNYTGPERKYIPGLRFGLITYKCDHMAGHLVSEFDCKACNFHCSVEELNEDCEEDTVRIWAGIIVGVCLSAIVNGFIFKFLRRRAKPETILVLADDLKGFRRVGRSEGRETLKSTASLAKATLGIASILLFKTAIACDYTLVMRANATVMFCNDVKCSSALPSSFPLRVGQEVCVDDVTGERVILNISEITYRSRYAMAYYTSDYKMSGVSTVGSCCSLTDEEENCYNKTLAKIEAKESSNPNSFHFHYAIIPYLFRSDFDQDHSLGCIYFGTKERVGQLYPIYTMIGQTWSVNFVANKNNKSRSSITVSTYDPVCKSIGLELSEINKIPISVIDVLKFEKSEVMLYNDKLYYVNASKVDEPEDNTFGDFQTSLDKDKEIYSNTKDGKCLEEYVDCTCECSFPKIESRLSQFVQSQDDFHQPSDFLMREKDKSVIDIYDTFKEGSVQMRIGDWKIEDSAMKEAKCDIQFLTSYTCTSCNESSYIVLEARSIEQEGHVPFYSNCSFESEYVNCDFEPTKLILKGTYRSCFIGMPTLKKSVLVELKHDFQYEFTRKVNCTMTYTGYGEAFAHLFTSGQFLGSLVITVLFCCLSMILAFIFNKLLKDYFDKKRIVRIV